MLQLGLLACCLNGSCAFHKTANDWNGLVGPTGHPVHLNATTKVGFNFLVFFPFIGRIAIDGMVDEATLAIREQGGDFVRVLQSRSENYWFAVPPFTFVVTPVVHSLVVEYRPQPNPGLLELSGAVAQPPDLYPRRSYDGQGRGY